MSGRLIAIGDIHGHAAALAALIRRIKLQPGDTLVTLGDYVDRGPDSKGVLCQLIELESRCNLVPLMGNHEEMMLGAKEGRDDFKFWMQFGGDATLDSYGTGRTMSLVPWDHWAFLKRLRLYHQSDRHFFVHANYFPNRPLPEQDSQTVLWRPLENNDLPGGTIRARSPSWAILRRRTTRFSIWATWSVSIRAVATADCSRPWTSTAEESGR